MIKKLLCLLLIASPVCASWSGWTYRKQATIPSSKVSNILGTISNFTVVFVSTDVAFSTAAAGGLMTNNFDMIITTMSDCSGTYGVHWDTETFNNGVSGSSLTAHILMPVAITTATLNAATFYFCLGNSGVTTFQGGSTSAYDSNTKSMYFFNENITAFGQSTLDRTANHVNQLYYLNGSASAPSVSTGPIDGAIYMPSPNENSGAASSGTAVSGTGTGSVTISGWFRFNTTHAYDAAWNNIVDMYDSSGLSDLSLSTISGDTFVGAHFAYFSGGFQDVRTSTANISTGTWYQYAISYDNTTLSFYFNGSLVATALPGGHSRTGDVPVLFAFGNYTSRNSDVSFDQTHIDGTLRNADWIKTEYNNENSPATFFTVGPALTNGGGPTPNSLFFGAPL